ncbi:hypothetical protein ACHAXM_000244, partial [Skeletonema potamos]
AAAETPGSGSGRVLRRCVTNHLSECRRPIIVQGNGISISMKPC